MISSLINDPRARKDGNDWMSESNEMRKSPARGFAYRYGSSERGSNRGTRKAVSIIFAPGPG